MQYYQAALHQAAYMGLRVPKDMSLCYVASAWENDPSWSNATHIRLPEVQIGQQAASELLKLLNSKSGKAKRPKATLVQPELIEGKTVKVLI
jgi:DNA-binding LacI/PurR family transcriptional regulator